MNSSHHGAAFLISASIFAAVALAGSSTAPSSQPAAPATTQSDDIVKRVMALVGPHKPGEKLDILKIDRELQQIGPDAAPAVDELIKGLHSNDDTFRWNCVNELGLIGPPAKKAMPDLLKLVRGKAAKGLDSQALRAIVLIDPDPSVCVPLLIDAMKSDSDYAKTDAIRLLAVFGPAAKDAVPQLIDGLKSQDTHLRNQSAIALGAIGPAAAPALPILEKLTNQSPQDPSDVSAIAQGLVGDGKAGVPSLLKLLDAKDEWAKRAVFGALADLKIEAGAATPKMIEILDGKDDQFKASAIHVLGEIGPAARSAAPQLVRIAKENKEYISLSAAHALYSVDPDAAKQAGVLDVEKQYMAWIQEDAQTFREKRLAMSSAGEPVGCMVMWVNGDPVDFFTGGGSAQSLNIWLVPGKNELTFSQPHKPPVYVLINTMATYDQSEALAGQAFPGPGGTNPAPPLVFNVDTLRPLPQRDSLENVPGEQLTKEVQQQLEAIAAAINAHDGKKAADLLLAGEHLWTSPQDKADEAQRVTQIAKLASNPSLKARVTDQPIQLLVGKRAAMAFVQMPQNPKEDGPALMTVNNGKRDSKLPWLIFARSHGKLIVWKSSEALGFSLAEGK